jgi:hypothetical protein
MQGLELLHREGLHTVILGNSARTLQPPRQDLGGPGISDRAPPQTSLDVLI